ncbi:putative type IX secretion system sortase PorU2 [Crocinitomix catalasitica]|uniref:putative type IX secretion system sortase PorU2 n=1 Tax=Crocinitomix catalasitica TaxID=184607 RepID=UPI000481309A|nr:C25 family cysteine peptidase [Crocinitomix catalasitica]
MTLSNRKNNIVINLFFVFSFLGLTGNSFAQYGNEWIEYDQRYYAFKIAHDGVYKVDYTLLTSAGIPVETINTANFQLIGFDKEQPLWIEDGGDGSIDPGDYMLFYAQKNTSWLDSMLYDSPDDVSNKYYPHYNDTINYFLSWNSELDNKRFSNETDVDFLAYTPRDYFFRTTFKEGHNMYAEGHKVSGMSRANYMPAEGWYGGRIFMANPVNYQDDLLSTSNAFTGGGAPVATGVAVSGGGSNAAFDGAGNHHLRLQYGPSNITLFDTIYYGFQKNKLEFTIPATSLGASTTKIRHQLVNDLGVASDYQAVAFTEITYAHTGNLESQSYYEMSIPHNTLAAKSRYDFTNFSGTNPLAFTLDGKVRKIPVVISGGTYQVLIPNLESGANQKFVIVDETAIRTPIDFRPVNGTSYFTNYVTANFEDAYLMVSNRLIWAGANEYKAYRETVAGGGHNVLLVDVDELYLQFGGGVQKHVMGIRRFAHFAYNHATTKPSNLFLIGKGIREANENIGGAGIGSRQNAGSYATSLVPSFGYPSSDVLITARLEDNRWAPLLATGRIAAKSSAEVIDYLNKVKDFELAQDPNGFYSKEEKLWQKEILHFGGGSNEYEQNTFKFYLERYEGYLESPEFGGNVTSYYKSVSDPVDPVTLFEVTDKINDGVSFMTFFGHASADGFDQNIDDPENWDNKGKYPIVVGNACLTGGIFDPYSYSASEKYLIIPEKGAVAFIANVKQAFSNSLNTYSDEFFKLVGNTNYGGSLGEQVKKTIENIQYDEMSFGLQNVCNQMVLHGDPAIKNNAHDKPEFEIDNTSLFVNPSVIDLTVDSIEVNVVLYNLGRASVDTFFVDIKRTFPNGGGDSIYKKMVYGLNYIDTVIFTIPLYNNVGVGINTFTASVDIPSSVEEQFDEFNNNVFSKQVLFDVDGIFPAWPYNYAVLPYDTITVKGSTVNPFAGLATYRFELDTTDLFNSPYKKYKTISSLGGVIEVKYDEWLNATTNSLESLNLEDSTVCFWRVAVEDETGDYFWIENSFQYIENKSGWGQDHFFQFKNSDYQFIDYVRDDRLREFGPAFKTVECTVYGNANNIYEAELTSYIIDNNASDGYHANNYCTTNPQFLVVVIDPLVFKAWGTRFDRGGAIPMENPDYDFGNANDNGGCRWRVEWNFSFYQNNPEQLVAFENMIRNEIPDDYYYLIYTTRFANYSEWDILHPELYDMFTEIGADSIYAGRDEVPFIVFGKAGDPDFTKEVYGQNIDDIISLKDTLWGNDFYGEESSTLIGPAKKWDILYWQQHPREEMTNDSSRLKVYGRDYFGTQTLLIDTVLTLLDSIPNLDLIVDADLYPFLQLRAQHWDTIGFSPAQIDRWHILYEPVPEAALNGSGGIVWLPNQDTLIEGQKLSVSFDIDNISDYPMDSLLVNYWLEDAQRNIIPINYPRQDSLRIGETIGDTLIINTVGIAGYNSLWVEVNPYNGIGGTDQPEQYHFNNLGQIPFHVSSDEENPILDVTFDGLHVLNGDIVSPKTQVVITLKDENEYLIMNEEADTANFGIYLTDPQGLQKRLSFRNSLGEQILEWFPADASNKKFKIIYNADLNESGEYRLLVQGVDKSNNISGDFEYDITFEVDLHSSITQLMNYPNPFSTQTQFVFTLTGAVIPDEFTIQIMTVTGKVVREITIDELGPINIGRNITEFRWNGTDEFGDILANGVYLYHVITKIDNEDIDHRDSGADEYFKKDFGKMYIIR